MSRAAVLGLRRLNSSSSSGLKHDRDADLHTRHPRRAERRARLTHVSEDANAYQPNFHASARATGWAAVYAATRAASLDAALLVLR